MRFLSPLAVAPLLIPAPPARSECLLDYVDCVEAASELNSFAKRSLSGLGCYVDLISCLQRRLA
jgi:hypothetical protein